MKPIGRNVANAKAWLPSAALQAPRRLPRCPLQPPRPRPVHLTTLDLQFYNDNFIDIDVHTSYSSTFTWL